MRLSSSALALFVAGIVPSQTYVVDAAGGPGANFTSIVAAVAAVPDGSVLLVRAGTYAGFVIDNKGLTVLADPGVAIQAAWPPASTIVIQNTTATQPVVLRSFQLNGGGIGCMSCAGPVLFDQIQGGLLDIAQCTQVMATSSVFTGVFTTVPLASWPAVSVRLGSQFVLVDSSASISYGSGLSVQGSRVQVVSSVVDAFVFGAAIDADPTSDLRLLGNTTVTGPYPIGPNCAIAGFPSVRRASTVTLTGVVQASSMVVVANESLSGTGGTLGGSVSATLNGAYGNIGLLVLGVTGPPLLVPGIADSWWLDPGISASVALSVLSASVTATVPIPPTPALQGELFGFQGLYLTPTGLSVSNPYGFAIW